MKVRVLALVICVALVLTLPGQALAVKQTAVQNTKNNTLTLDKNRHSSSRNSFIGLRNNILVGFSFNLLGRPYRWGGESLRGFDCSGFTRYVFRHVHTIVLPRTSAGQARVGKAVQRQSLIPGDIVYFKTSRNRVSHVGIFIGKNLFIHSTKSGGVIISGLNESYYKKRYRGARRIVQGR